MGEAHLKKDHEVVAAIPAPDQVHPHRADQPGLEVDLAKNTKKTKVFKFQMKFVFVLKTLGINFSRQFSVDTIFFFQTLLHEINTVFFYLI